jgi:DNA-binding Lrp family transcriptional regulator
MGPRPDQPGGILPLSRLTSSPCRPGAAARKLAVDASLRIQVKPRDLDEAGRTLAAYPAVHGALATTGPASLHIAVWFEDLDHLYRFITRELAGLKAGQNLKRPGS